MPGVSYILYSIELNYGIICMGANQRHLVTTCKTTTSNAETGLTKLSLDGITLIPYKCLLD